MATPPSVDACVVASPCETQKALQEPRSLVRSAAPGVTERISCAIPAFDPNRQALV